MRELFPSCTPFIPAKYYTSLLPFVPFIPPPSASLPRSSTSFFPHEITHLPQENEFFLPLVTLLLMGK